MGKRRLISILATSLLLLPLAGCGTPARSSIINPKLDLTESVTIRVLNNDSASLPMEVAAASFMKKYPNCTVEYVYLSDWNANIETRLRDYPETVDLFMTTKLQPSDKVNLVPYAYDMLEAPKDAFSFEDTFQGLVNNYLWYETLDDGTKVPHQSTIPLGAEIRGMYTNVSLLKKLGLDAPTKYDEFLHCLEVASEDSSITPLYGTPDNLCQQLFYPYICKVNIGSNCNK